MDKKAHHPDHTHRRERRGCKPSSPDLLDQMRDANERLVLATMQADEHAEAAEYSEERFRSLIQASAALVWHADANGRVRVDVESWKSFTGVAPSTESDRAWQWLESVHPGDRERVRDAWATALATKSVYRCQHRLRAGDRYLWVDSRAVPIIRSGSVREWIGMMTDVTERVRVEEAREQFIGILGHDLRNPLTAILLGAQLFVDLPDPLNNVAARIIKSAERMQGLIRDVMDFARGRLGGGIPVALTMCDLGALCRDVVAEMKQAHPTRNIECDIAEDLRADCDADRIEQVLSNLLGNAITHGEDPIRLYAKRNGNDIQLEVTNQGRPISEATITTLFEPFARGMREARTPDDGGATPGLGLGLYIVREIIRAHRGQIAVTSTPDGTRFTIRWPRAAHASARLVSRS